VVTALSHGLAISIAPHNTMLTTQEAADLLDYRDRTRRERRQTLDQMATDAEDDNLYEVTARPKRTR
jgi:hypothetical protein